jgi:hypothetical protein
MNNLNFKNSNLNQKIKLFNIKIILLKTYENKYKSLSNGNY